MFLLGPLVPAVMCTVQYSNDVTLKKGFICLSLSPGTSIRRHDPPPLPPGVPWLFHIVLLFMRMKNYTESRLLLGRRSQTVHGQLQIKFLLLQGIIREISNIVRLLQNTVHVIVIDELYYLHGTPDEERAHDCQVALPSITPSSEHACKRGMSLSCKKKFMFPIPLPAGSAFVTSTSSKPRSRRIPWLLRLSMDSEAVGLRRLSI